MRSQLNNSLKVVFFGTPRFAAEILEFLLENGIDIPLIVTRKDKPKGRNLEVIASPVKEVAIKRGIPFFQPETASDDESFQKLKAMEADLFIVAAFGEILKQRILDLPKLACVNVHTSLLPKYRGAAPIQRAIMEGEKMTGVTIMHMVRKMDAGEIISQKEVIIDPLETFGELEEKLIDAGKDELLKVLQSFKIGKPKALPQNESFVTYAAKIELEDCKINWENSSESIHNLIRGVNPYPGAWTSVLLNKKPLTMKIWSSKVLSSSATSPKKIKRDKTQLVVETGEGLLEILELQLQGKQKMTVKEWLQGVKNQELEFI